MSPDSSLFIAGHRGMVGAALLRHFRSLGYSKLLTATRQELDLTRQAQVEEFMAQHRPQGVILAAAKVGGIFANSTFPADFLCENLLVATNVIRAAARCGTSRLLFLGSSCIYPKFAPQPIPEEALLTSPLEPTNEAYAIAKIAGLKLCQFERAQNGHLFHSAMPTNLYGPGDNYHPEHSHVIPALLRRFHEAKLSHAPKVTIWGTGTPRREFLHVDDLASACDFLFQLEDPPDWTNVGYGDDISIAELAALVASTVGYGGEIVPDPSKPDGTPRKLMDSSRLRELGWTPQIDLATGLASAYQDFLTALDAGQARL